MRAERRHEDAIGAARADAPGRFCAWTTADPSDPCHRALGCRRRRAAPPRRVRASAELLFELANSNSNCRTIGFPLHFLIFLCGFLRLEIKPTQLSCSTSCLCMVSSPRPTARLPRLCDGDHHVLLFQRTATIAGDFGRLGFIVSLRTGCSNLERGWTCSAWVGFLPSTSFAFMKIMIERAGHHQGAIVLAVLPCVQSVPVAGHFRPNTVG